MTDAADPAVRRRKRLLRTVGVGILGILLVVFVVLNSQDVDVNLWGVHSHTRLIWVIVGCLAIGAAVGYLIGRPMRRSRNRKGRSPAG